MGQRFLLILKGTVLFITFCTISIALRGQYELVGSASQLNDTCFLITPDQTFQTGSVWYQEQVDISRSFDIYFQISLGCKDLNGADGIAFVLQQAGSGIGGFGLDLGYGGIFPSMIIEFDTYQNTNRADPVYDHVAIMSNGRAEHNTSHNRAGPIPILPTGTNAEDCRAHSVRIHWNARSNTLEVYVDCQLRLSYTHDLIANIFFNNPNVFWGFTGSTGGLSNVQGFCLKYVSFTTELRDTTICQGDSVPLNLSGGLAYTWSPAFGLSDPNVPDPIASPDTTTTYIASISLPCGNTWEDTITITVQSPGVDAGTIQEICIGDSLILSAQGTGTVSWSPGILMDDSTKFAPTVFPSVSTLFTVTLTDLLGCRANDTVTVDVNPLPNLDIQGDSTFCPGDSLLLIASGAEDYEWAPIERVSSPFSPSTSIAPEDTSTYFVIGTDSLGCENLISYTLRPSPVPNITLSPDTAICFGDSIQIEAQGATEYQWKGSPFLSQTNIPNPLLIPTSSQFYEVVGTNAFGCKDSNKVLVEVLFLPQVNLDPDPSFCEGDTAQLNASGGIAYKWSPNISISDPNVSNPFVFPLDSTVYTVRVWGPNGCQVEEEVNAFVLAPPQIYAGEDTFICEGEFYQLQASGGIRYEWSPNEHLNDPNIPDPITITPAYIAYQLKGEDANGCVGTDSIEIRVRAVPELVTGNDTSICRGESIALSVSGAESYTWTPALTLSDPNASNPISNTNETIRYTVAGVDSFGCVNEDTLLLTVFDTPFISGPLEYEICKGDTALLTMSFAPNYLWSTGENTSFIEANPITSQNYWVVAYEGGCWSDSVFVQVNVDPFPPIPNYTVDLKNDLVPIELSFVNSSQFGESYVWDFGDGNFSTEENPFHTYSRPGIFSPLLTITNSAGCIDSIRAQTFELFAPSLYIPTAFSPNGDGHNDLFFFNSFVLKELQFQIYDRWGRKVFNTQEEDFHWDGTMNGKPLPGGVYTYVLSGRNFDNRSIQKQGNIHLIR